MKTILLILTFSMLTVFSQLLLKKGVSQLHFNCLSLYQVKAIVSSPYIILSFTLQCACYIIWLYILSRANLGYAVAFSGGFFYISLPIFSWLIYGERLTSMQWVGLSLISLGILCMIGKGKM